MQYDEIKDAYRQFVSSMGPQALQQMDKVQIQARNIEELNNMYSSSLMEVSNLRVKLNFAERKELKKDDMIKNQTAKITKLYRNVEQLKDALL